MASSHFLQLHGSEHNDVSDSLDRLSELPDSLILSILSLLSSTRDVVRTTVLSKRWKDLWTTVPYLELDDENPEFICGVVAQWRGAKIRRFYLCLSPPPTSTDLDSWLLFAVEKQLGELHLYADIPYCLPQSLYSCSSITTLHLHDCSLEIEGSVQLNQLVTLSVHHIRNSSWVEAINKLLLGAPRLENMSLSMPEINENFNIISLSLKALIIEEAEIKGVLAISAPKLLTSRIHASIFNGASFLCHVPSLTEACFVAWGLGSSAVYDPPLETFYKLLRSICHVKKVDSSLLNIKLLLSLKKKKKEMVVQFPNAEVLKHTSMGRQYNGLLDLVDVLGLLELFPELKMLSFHQIHQNFRDFNPIKVETTFPNSSLLHLERVDMTWSAHDPSIIPFIQILLQISPSLEKMVFRLRKCRDNLEELLMVEEKVRSMPRSSPTAEVIIIDC